MNNSTTDAILLGRFRETRDDSAFQELVRRYLGMVLGVAQRRTGDAWVAEEIAQNTFCILARKATTLRSDVVLGGWLHRVVTLEAADYNRKEYRRRKVMKELNEVTNAESHRYTSEPLTDLLVDLDDALERLSQRDRDALVLRFHAGMRFGEIAERLGKSEDAARKQVNRSIDRLARLLGKKHGAGLATTTVVAGLQLALTQNAPAAAMVKSITVGALSTLPTSAVGSTLTLKLFCIMKTQTNIIAAIAVLLGTASFFIGRHSSASFNQSLVEHVERDTLNRQEFGTMRRAREQAPLPEVTRSISQIVDDAAASFRQRSLSNVDYYNAVIILNELQPGDYDEAIAYLEKLNDDKRVYESVAAILVGIWASVDGKAAVVWAEENLDDKRGVAFQNVLTSWSEHDPEAAYAWYLNKAEIGDSGMQVSSFRWLSKPIFTGWVRKAPEAALTALAEVSVEDESGAIFGVAEAVSAAIDPQPILTAINAMDDGRIREKLVREVAGAWAKEEPHSAAAWVDTLSMESGMARLAAKAEVAEEWVRHSPDDLKQVGAWLLTGAPENMRAEITGMIAKQLEKHQESGGE